MIELLILLVVFGVALYLVNTFIPMARPVKIIINVIVVLFLVLWLVQYFGLADLDFHRYHARHWH